MCKILSVSLLCLSLGACQSALSGLSMLGSALSGIGRGDARATNNRYLDWPKAPEEAPKADNDKH
jgi:hypothetical protein